ncbi:hypothetical protein AHiyo1_31030 [Arthrobacter sp. Hiyo1]|nr:hypothetical protein AHiyo1_31030 [Arthrobacter sp. Hiyo1]
MAQEEFFERRRSDEQAFDPEAAQKRQDLVDAIGIGAELDAPVGHGEIVDLRQRVQCVGVNTVLRERDFRAREVAQCVECAPVDDPAGADDAYAVGELLDFGEDVA